MLSYQSLLKYNALYFSHYYFETGYSFSPGLLKVLRFLDIRGVLLRQECNGQLIVLEELSCGCKGSRLGIMIKTYHAAEAWISR